MKIYLLTILSIFLFNPNTQAIDINIDDPFPNDFFNNIEKSQGNKRWVITFIKNSLNSLQKSEINNIVKEFNEMINNLNCVKINHETFTQNNEIYQCVLIEYGIHQYFINFHTIKKLTT